MAKKLTNAIAAMETMMTPESIERSRQRAEQEIFLIKLSQLREKCGLKQNEIENFRRSKRNCR